MQLEKIITLANKAVLYPFLAMERSLRATGCKLPLWVIPYDEDRFELPENAIWWENEDFFNFLKENNSKPAMRRYACLTEPNFHYIDSDCIFLQTPEEFLKKFSGWVSCCCHWHNPEHTFTEESLKFLKIKSTTWQKSVFNSGQFACDTPLYTWKSLVASASDPSRSETILQNPFHDQPGLNWLVALKENLQYTNLTLPPYSIESSWAGDYEDYPSPLWADPAKKPYVIHWAGQKPTGRKKIDELFFKYLTKNEKELYLKTVSLHKNTQFEQLRNKMRHAWQAFLQDDN